MGDQVLRIAQALDLPFEAVFEVIFAAQEAQRRKRPETRACDGNYYLYVRMGPCVYPRYTLGYRLDDKTAIDIAVDRARELKRRRCLNTPGGKSYWFSGDAARGRHRGRWPEDAHWQKVRGVQSGLCGATAKHEASPARVGVVQADAMYPGVMYAGQSLDGFAARLTGADTDALLQSGHEDLTVADGAAFARARAL